MNCGEYQTKALTADAVEELQIAFRGKTEVCESGNKIKAGICIQPDNVKEIRDIVSYAVKNGFAVTSSNNPEWTIGAERAPEGSIFVCLRNLSNTFKNNYLFTGKELDNESSLQYFEARYYNPDI